MSLQSTSSFSLLKRYEQIVDRELVKEFNYVDDIISGRANARTDLTDKIMHVLGVTLSTGAGIGIGAIASPLGQLATGALTTLAVEKGEEWVSNKRKEERIIHIGQLFDAAGKVELSLLAKKVAKEAMHRYEHTICKLEEDQISTFARIGICRMFDYLGRTKKPLTMENLLIGLIEGKSGGGIEGIKNKHLSCKNGDDLTAEGAYSRAAFCTEDRKVWVPPKKDKTYGYAKLKAQQPKYYIRVPKDIVENYWAMPIENPSLLQPSFIRRICTDQDIQNYLHSSNNESFNEYLKSVYPDAQIGVYRGDLSQFDLSKKDFSGSDLSGCKISGSLKNTKFHGTDLSNVQFVKILSAENAEFTHADLSEAHLEGNFKKANFIQADLTYSTCKGDFTSIRSEGTIWVEADLNGMQADNRSSILEIQKQQLDNELAFKQSLTKGLDNLPSLMGMQKKKSEAPDLIEEFIKNITAACTQNNLNGLDTIKLNQELQILRQMYKKIAARKDIAPFEEDLKKSEPNTDILKSIKKLAKKNNEPNSTDAAKKCIERLEQEINDNAQEKLDALDAISINDQLQAFRQMRLVFNRMVETKLKSDAQLQVPQ